MLNVFIADDSILVRERITELLADLPEVNLVGQAGNVPDAVAGIQRLRPDAVILDIRMPGGSGIEVLETIKMYGSGPLVIMLTAYAQPQYRERCLAAGADYFFDKTTEFDQITRVLRGWQPANATLSG